MNRGELARCPECHGPWPKGPDYDLRGCGWLHGLDRTVSPSNNELLIHDGLHGRDRFLQLEIKAPKEGWPPMPGQLRTLRALAGQPNWTVQVLRGTTRWLDAYPVDQGGLGEPIRTHVEAVRRAVNAWLRGALWRDAQSHLSADVHTAHTHGWARVDGVWTCVGDHYAAGLAEQEATACGATMPQFP